MTKKLAVFAVLLLAGGCRMCSDCCDYSPAVPGGIPLGPVRAGSVLSGGMAAIEPPVETAPMQTASGDAQGATVPQAPVMPR